MTKINLEDFKIDQSMVHVVLRPLVKTGHAALTCVYPEPAIPAALIASIYAETRQNSTQKMLEELKHEFDDLNSRNLISEDYLYSDSYTSLMIDILKKVYVFNKDEKRKTVARIYKGVVQKQLDYDESNEKIFLDALEKTTAQEILILDFFDRNQNKLSAIGSWANLYELFLTEIKNDSIEKHKFKYESGKSSAGLTPMGSEFLRYLKDETILH